MRVRPKFIDKKVDVYKRISSFTVFLIRLSLLGALIFSAYYANWIVVFASVATLILTFFPEMFERRYEIDIPEELEIVTALFIFAAIFLGEAHGFYTRFWWWDLVLHGGSAFVFGFIGFIILFVLQRTNKVGASPFWIGVFSFCFAVAIGALWEIFEFIMDFYFGFNMQKSGLFDTMSDLIVDSIGAFIVSLGGYVYLKSENEFIFGRTIRRFVRNNPHLFKM